MKKHDERVVSLATSRTEWEPSPLLGSEAACAIWTDIVNSVTADHFAAGDEVPLALYCDCVARLMRVRDAIDKLPLVTKDAEKNRTRRLLTAERVALTSQITTLARILRLVPAARRGVNASRTDMPTQNRSRGKTKPRPGDDLFAC